MVELGAVDLGVGQIGQFLDIDRTEVVALDGPPDLVVVGFVAGREKIAVLKNFHRDGAILRIFQWRYCSQGDRLRGAEMNASAQGLIIGARRRARADAAVA
ncbi:hypothetical protein [Massilia pseudoviolaceinigra]|uniref:hypothetical protein n=1 Tax=Massilia pseudoviolaceinigra TaxID=3057165 RepID=UPI002796D694|nr:hypothetical protein [Massilia sp. CCM 9206]MDQ1924350.1 hypothetical protein [Massilia sp. CCM 9206]